MLAALLRNTFAGTHAQKEGCQPKHGLMIACHSDSRLCCCQPCIVGCRWTLTTRTSPLKTSGVLPSLDIRPELSVEGLSLLSVSQGSE